MSTNDLRPTDLLPEGDYLCREDLWDISPEVTISDAAKMLVPDPKTGVKRPLGVLQFVGAKKALVLSKTNARFLIRELGGATLDDWRGKRVKLYVDKSWKAFGQLGVICLAIGDRYSGHAAPPREPKPPAKSAPPPVAPAGKASGTADLDH